MGTVHDVSVVRTEWPSNVTGGWGEVPVLVDGARGGWAWRVRFLRNPGTYGGATFPPGSGDVHGLAVANPYQSLTGTAATVETVVVADGSRHLDGGATTLTFTQDGFGSATTGDDELAFNTDAASMEAALESLPNLGAATVTKGLVTGKKVPGVQAYFSRDSSVGLLVGGTDLTRWVAPGEVLRFGGASSEDGLAGTDGEQLLGSFGSGSSGGAHSGHVLPGSPLVYTDADHAGLPRATAAGAVAAGRSLRLAGVAYAVTKTGAEVQQVVVGAPAAFVANMSAAARGGGLYKLRLTYNGVANATTACLPFNATARQLQAEVEGLANVGVGNVIVTRRGTGMGAVSRAVF